jgi:hypothetical protein
MTKAVLITKADGKEEPFIADKLRRSLLHAGANDHLCDSIVSHIEKELTDGMSTREIYKHAFFLLHKMEKPVALRYSLRRALFDLGPSGFPFELIVAEIFKGKGYKTETGQVVRGHCTMHEVDCIAWNENKVILAEAKFHNQIGLKSDVKIALYVKARFDDLRNTTFMLDGVPRKMTEGWLITNTKFSQNAIEYGQCSGIHMVGWNYPAENNLHDLIEDADMHPITSLTSLSVSEKNQLLAKKIVLARMLREDPSVLKEFGHNEDKIITVMREIEGLH